MAQPDRHAPPPPAAPRTLRALLPAALALAAVFAVKLAVLSSLGQHPLLTPAGDLDGAYYVHFAQRVADGDVWLESRDSFLGQPPAPFFLAPLYIYVLALS